MKLQILLIVLIISSVSYSQSTQIEGNIVRINFTDEEVDLTDTICSWYDRSGEYEDQNKGFWKTFNYNQHQYLYGTSSYYIYTGSIDLGGGYGFIFDLESKIDTPIIGLNVGGIVREFYCLDDQPHINKTNSGIWLLFDDAQNSVFIDSMGSFNFIESYTDTFLVYIAGKVNNSYLTAIFKNYDQFEYQLNDLSSSPNIDFSDNKKVYFDTTLVSYKPKKIVQLKEDLYLCQPVDRGSKRIDLFQFEDSTFNFIKSFDFERISDWGILSGKIYINRFLDDRTYGITTIEFDYLDSSLVNERIIYSPKVNFCVNDDFTFAAHLANDSLYLFNILEERIQNKWAIDGLSLNHNIIVGDDEVFVHHISKITDVEAENGQQNISEFNLEQNYPNPFNPVTTINYTIPVGEANFASPTTLIVYDVLGNEIKTLVNEQQPPGKYSVEFDGSNLASGVYFYRLRVRAFSATKKLILLK